MNSDDCVEVTEVPSLLAPIVRETDLRSPVAAWLEAEFNSVALTDELDLGWAAPDLVAAVPVGLAERLATEVDPICHPGRIWALAELAEPRTELHLRAGTSASWAKYRADVLDPLVADGLISRDETGNWRGEQPLPGVFPHAVAVELKLRDWRKAIAQASRYRAFAEATYIAMPAARLSAVALAAAEARGVGVLAVTGDGVECLVRSPSRPALDGRVRALVSEMMLASYLGLRHSAPAGSPRGRPLSAALAT